MSLRIKEKVRKIRRSLSWHSASIDRRSSTRSDTIGNGSIEPSLPHGWESAIDKDGRVFFINAAEKVSTYVDPRHGQEDVEVEYPETRIVTLKRDAHLGFGFVAGSEKPVVVRCVTEGGPSDGFLLPGDQIHKINCEDVRYSPRTRVIELVRSAERELELTISQPPTISTQGKKSILLNAAKKQQRLKRDSSASRVRFSEDSLKKKKPSLSVPNSIPSLLNNNVLKVQLETNQSRSFKYDDFTKIKDVLDALKEKLSLTSIEHFGLVLHNTKSPLSAKMTVLSPQETVVNFSSSLEEDAIKCLFRLVYVPRDAYDLLRKDATAFQYFYTQCCQDVIHERFSSDLKCDVALRLASLHMQEYALEKHIPFNKITIKLIEKEFGLGLFLNPSMLRAVRPKELRKMLSHFMKMNQSLLAPGQHEVTPLQAKLHYMKTVCELRSFGGKCFLATLVDRKAEVMLLVGPKCGISQVTDIKSFTLHMLADFDLIDEIQVEDEKGGATKLIQIILTDENLPNLMLSMMKGDAKDFLTFVEGYYLLFVGCHLPLSDSDVTHSAKSRHSRGRSPLGHVTPPSSPDHNHNSVENDYATIEDIQTTLNANSSGLAPPLLPEDNLGTATVLVTGLTFTERPDTSGSSETDSSQASHIPSISPNLASGSVTGSADNTRLVIERHYDVTPDSTPASCIDDIIMSTSPRSSPDGSLNISRESANSMDLTQECFEELTKLNDCGAILDPRMFKDKGVYLDPLASPTPQSTFDLASLPLPPDEAPPTSPSPSVPPPPAFFSDKECEVSGQMVGAATILVNGDDDKSIGEDVESDDSGTETLDRDSNDSSTVTYPTQPLENIVVNTSTSFSVNTTNRTPATSLRSRLLEQRAQKSRQDSANQTPELKEDYRYDSTSIFSNIPSCKPKPVEQKPQPNLIGAFSDSTTKEFGTVNDRMVDALMRFANDISSDSSDDEVDPQCSNEGNDTELWGMGDRKMGTPTPTMDAGLFTAPMMLEGSHIDVSTEEEDNTSDERLNYPKEFEADITLTVGENSEEPMYMNHEIETDVVDTNTRQKDAAAAIDEALDGLSAASDSEMEETMKVNILERKPDPEKKPEPPKSSPPPITLDGFDGNLDQLISEPAPQPPPRRRRGMSASSSVSSLSMQDTSRESDSPHLRPPPSLIAAGSANGSPRLNINLPSGLVSSHIGEEIDSSLRSGANSPSVSSKVVMRKPKPAAEEQFKRSISNTSIISTDRVSTGSGRMSTGNTNKLSVESPRWGGSPRSGSPNTHHRRSGISKSERVTKTASVIGLPTNITCTATDVLANLVPLKPDGYPQLPKSTSQRPHITLTSRESLLDEIVKNAHGLGIDPLGLVNDPQTRVRRASITSNQSIRPEGPPPPPPNSKSPISNYSRLHASRSESDLLQPSSELMHEVEYKTIDDSLISNEHLLLNSKPPPSPSDGKRDSTTSARYKELGLERDDGFIKFSGYAGEPQVSPSVQRRGKFKKKQRPATMSSEHIVGESTGKRGIMSKILNTIKPRKRSMSLDRLNAASDGTKPQGGSLKIISDPMPRPSILPHNTRASRSTQSLFQSIGRTRFHSQPDNVSLNDLVFRAGFNHTSPVKATVAPPSSSQESGEVCNLGLKQHDQVKTPQDVLDFLYEPDCAFDQALEHIETIQDYFITYCETQWAPSLEPNPHKFLQLRENINANSRQLITNSKQLVASVTQASKAADQSLVGKMAATCRTLARIVEDSVDALKLNRDCATWESLHESLSTICDSFKELLNTSKLAAGKDHHDENMATILNKVSQTASLLTLFIRSLKSLTDGCDTC